MQCHIIFRLIPELVGVPVRPHVRRAGPYLLGPRLGHSPVKSIVQCLARRDDGSADHYMLKILTLGPDTSAETQDEQHGKMLLHTEHALLSLLEGERGVVKKHGFFTELCLHEDDLGRGRLVYNGRRTKR